MSLPAVVPPPVAAPPTTAKATPPVVTPPPPVAAPVPAKAEAPPPKRPYTGRKRGRKPGPVREKTVIVRLTDKEKDDLTSTARRYKLSLSDFVRMAIKNVKNHGFVEEIKK